MALPTKPLKGLTIQQRAFLDALKGDAKGDLKLAKDLAGYSPNSNLQDIIHPLKDHIMAAIKDILVMNGPNAAFGLIDVIADPAQMGASNKIKASAEVLDRIGVTVPKEDNSNIQKAAVFILPPKGIQNIQVEDGKVTINTDGDIKTIDNDTLIDTGIDDEDNDNLLNQPADSDSP